MSISYIGGDETVAGARRSGKLLSRLQLLDAGFALAALVAWAYMSPFLAEPIKWATAHGLSPNPGLLEYPYSLFWMLPCAGIGLSWVANKAEKWKAAVWLAFFPMLFFGLAIGWYYLAPRGWL
jgi:hypothetical protein